MPPVSPGRGAPVSRPSSTSATPRPTSPLSPPTAAPLSPRSFIVWVPDWPVVAWLLSEGGGADQPVAVIAGNRVLACSSSARLEGVRRGHQRREAQSICPTLQVIAADPARDQRIFDPLIARLEEMMPGVHVLRPGMVAIRVRGPARYYGSEEAAASEIIRVLDTVGVADARVGVADGIFAAEQAAYAAQPILCVPDGGSPSFLASLPISRLGDEELTRLLTHLGVRTLGDFAALNPTSVRDRLGDYGIHLHDLAAGRDRRPHTPRIPPVELSRQIEFETPFDTAEPVIFSTRRTAEDFIAGLGADHLVCTQLRVIITFESGQTNERTWLHSTAFSVSSVIDRVRWQLASLAKESAHPPMSVSEARANSGVINSGVVQVRFEPAAVDAAWRHEPGLFGSGVDERVHHTLSRLQSMLGYDGVLTATIGGGRWLGERQVLVPWGERAVTPQPSKRPWPGHLPAPLPSVVFPFPRPIAVLAVGGSPVQVDERGNLTATPRMMVDGPSEGQNTSHPADFLRIHEGNGDCTRRRITAWAGPWPIDERTWDSSRQRHACRFQAVDADQRAWLLVLDEGGSWWIEGAYD